jgi:hypothetical protein
MRYTAIPPSDALAQLAAIGVDFVTAPAGRDTADLLLSSRAFLFAAGADDAGADGESQTQSQEAAAADEAAAAPADSAAASTTSSSTSSGSSSSSSAAPAVVIVSNDGRFRSALRYLASQGATTIVVTAQRPDRYYPTLPPDWGRHPLGAAADAVVGWRGVGNGGVEGASMFGECLWMRRGEGDVCN